MTKIRTTERLEDLASKAASAAKANADQEGWAHAINAGTLRAVAARATDGNGHD